jgi:hypothetical protein
MGYGYHLGRSEYGLEIVTEIAYLVYIVGLSFDKVCLLLNFFRHGSDFAFGG